MAGVEVEAGYSVKTLHRFYYNTTDKQLLAASGPSVKWFDGATTWSSVVSGWTVDAEVTMTTWGPKNAVYIANGTEQPIKWSGTAASTLSAFPQTTRQFLPVLDRLLFIDDVNPSYIGISQSFSDTAIEAVQNSLAVPGPGRIQGMGYHGLTTDAGFATRIVIAKSREMYLLTANDLTPASIDARLDILAPFVGCEAWRTIVSTPIGTLFLGTNRRVYLITYDSRVIDVSDLVRSNNDAVEGIENIPSTQIRKCHAVYHDGFYKLFIVPSSGTYVTTQWWLDCASFGQDRDGYYGPWFGPMLGQFIAHAIVQDGPTDAGQLIGGEARSATGSHVYVMNSGTADIDTAISAIYQTNFDVHKRPGYTKIVDQAEIEYAEADGSLVISSYDSTGLSDVPESETLVGTSAVYWDELYWDEFYWSSAAQPKRHVFVPSNRLFVRYLSMRFEFSSAVDRFKLYALGVIGQIRSRMPFRGSVARV